MIESEDHAMQTALELKKMFEKLESKESKTSSLKSESEESVKDDKN